MSKNPKKLSRADKILICLFRITDGTEKKVKYEDLVVELFKQYPNDFHIKGYPEYPDASDSSQRSLYTEKQKGHVLATNKIFSLTQSGIDHVNYILTDEDEIEKSESDMRYSRTVDAEVERIKRLEGFSIYVSGKESEITENDVYRYFSITPRTSNSAVKGRLKIMSDLVGILSSNKIDPLFSKMVDYHNYLRWDS